MYCTYGLTPEEGRSRGMVQWHWGEESVFDRILYLVVSAKSQLLGLFGPLPQTL